ncbi:MAG: phage minor head protein [Desulfuromonadaceae bacterium]|nr:phage minor head protein [Desulfuromonadaceae bacterium]
MSKSVFSLPFEQAQGFFKDKLNIPSRRWDDLWQAEHAKGFMVAGAMQADLLADFRGAVEKAIAGDVTLAQFREQFDATVQKHGWSYNGGRNWRSAIIYDTNVTTAYQAGRWQQFAQAGVTHLMYVHSDGVTNPRPEHVALHGTVRPIDDPFWQTHYPPNGWGCQCRAVRAEAEEETEPPQGWDAVDPRTGAPVGVGKGWAYNVGQAGQEQGFNSLAAKLEVLPYGIAKSWTASMLSSPPFERFYTQKSTADFPVAVLAPQDMQALGAGSQTVWFSAHSLAEHLKKHPDIGLADYRKIQRVMDAGEVYQNSELQLTYLYLEIDGKLYRAGIKATASRAENYFLTLFETTEEKKKTQTIREMKRIR